MPPMADAASDIAAGVYAWRDSIARAEDKSTRYYDSLHANHG